MSSGLVQLTKACSFAAFKHRNQKRKNGNTPYINHPLEVLEILASSGVEDIETLCAGVLHDTIEDTQTT
jgi:guanosine-3',5'-bis(diphosphate) 3'-pyrophosphohydrolase